MVVRPRHADGVNGPRHTGLVAFYSVNRRAVERAKQRIDAAHDLFQHLDRAAGIG